MTTNDLILKANTVAYEEYPDSYSSAIELEDVRDMLIEFAQFHVTEALKAALEDIPYGGSDSISYDDVEHILESYPLTNIK
jgi:hypothetical protein